MDKIILDIKAVSGIVDGFIAGMINDLKVSDHKLGLILNFGCDRLEYKRIVF